MKRMTILAILLCLLLCGCAEDMPEVTTLPTEQAGTEHTVPETAPTSIYDADSEIEQLTSGAVRAFNLDDDCFSFAVMGSDVVIFSGESHCLITKLTGEELFSAAHYQTSADLSDKGASLQITEKGVSWFDSKENELVLLDASLREISRTKFPEQVTGSVVLSADRKFAYFCTADGVRVLDMQTGIGRMVKQIPGQKMDADALLMEDTVLVCRILNEDESVRSTLFISPQTGETIAQRDGDIIVSSYGGSYYAMTPEGAMEAMVFGDRSDELLLLPSQILPDRQWYLESANAAVTWTDGVFDLYDLSSGKRTAALVLPDFDCEALRPDPDGNGVYMMGSYQGKQVLCLWDTAATYAQDEHIYTSRRYTAEKPDTAGLEACEEMALQIAQKYDIEVLIGSNAAAVQSEDYAMEAEYQVPLILRELEALDRRLRVYPEGFLATAAKGTESGIVRICLVRQVSGTPESGNNVYMDGAGFWIDENAYAAIPVGRTTDRTFYHTMFHVLETRIMSKSRYCYEWEAHNPEDFAYDYNYTSYLSRDAHPYLEGENRAFIDSYSMTFPREDRATIMAYAMTEGNEEYFQSEILQEKLLAICKGIRKAFGLEKSKDVYLWEQYLKEPIAYKK